MDKNKRLLVVMNKIRTHNTIVNLRNSKEEIVNKSGKILKKYEEMLKESNDKNIILENENINLKIEVNKKEEYCQKLKKENEYYVELLNRIPKFILRILTNKKNKLLE